MTETDTVTGRDGSDLLTGVETLRFGFERVDDGVDIVGSEEVADALGRLDMRDGHDFEVPHDARDFAGRIGQAPRGGLRREDLERWSAADFHGEVSEEEGCSVRVRVRRSWPA